MKIFVIALSLVFFSSAWAQTTAPSSDELDSGWITCHDKADTICYEINLNNVIIIEQQLKTVFFHYLNHTETFQFKTFRACDVLTVKEGRHCLTKEKLESLKWEKSEAETE